MQNNRPEIAWKAEKRSLFEPSDDGVVLPFLDYQRLSQVCAFIGAYKKGKLEGRVADAWKEQDEFWKYTANMLSFFLVTSIKWQISESHKCMNMHKQLMVVS